MDQVITAVTIARDHAIADTGATSIFIMDGVNVINKRVASKPLTINLTDGKKVQPSHVCDIEIPGLPTLLTGHIVPSLTVASLIGIHPLCKAGCKVIFDDLKCDIVYNGKVILEATRTHPRTCGRYPLLKMCVPPQDPISYHTPAPV